MTIGNMFIDIFAKVTLVQLLIVLFALFAWSRAIIRLKKKDISIGVFMFWSLLWMFVILIAVFPDVMWSLADIVGVGRAVDLAMYISIIALFYMVFRLYVIIDEKNREMTKLVREIAIKDAQNNGGRKTAKGSRSKANER